MALETATYISSLNSANPASTDGLAQGDDHIRLIKSTLQATFPNVAGAATISHTQLTALATALTAGLSLCATGMIAPYANAFTNASWLRCDGATYTNAAQPALAAFMAQGGTSFVVPNLEDTGRFIRSITSGLTAGTAQANALKSHLHTATASTTGSAGGTTGNESTDHSHTFSGTTDGQSNSHNHGGVWTASSKLAGDGGSSVNVSAPGDTSGTSGNASADHDHTYSGTTGGQTFNHHHSFSVSISASTSVTVAATGSTETRPEAYAAVYYIHV
jgi:hypothetical protein